MRIKFLRTTPSSRPDVPFQAGQIIHIATSPDVQRWLREGDAMVLPDDTTEVAVPPSAERQAVERQKAKR